MPERLTHPDHEGPHGLFAHSVAVPYYAYDQQGVAYNMWHLSWCDEAYPAYLKHLGIDYADLRARGHDQQLVHAEIDWLAAVIGEDRSVEVRVRTARLGTTSFDLAYEIHVIRTRSRAIAAQLRITYVNVVGEKSAPMHPRLRTALQASTQA